MAARTFPMLREHGRYIVFAETSPETGAMPVLARVESDDLRAFIVEACNTHSTITVESARLCKARADLAEVRLREALGEPAPAEFGFYAGLALDKLSVGPFKTLDEAVNAARHEHGARKSIFVVEAKPAEPVTDIFGSTEIDRVLQWIEDANAFPGGRDAVLPPIRQHHEADLAKRLNTAARQWMTANGINLITASLGEARSHHVVIPHEVDSVTTRPVLGGVARLAPVAPVAAEVGFFPGERTPAEDEPGIPLAEIIALACCSFCVDPIRCGNQGCVTEIASRQANTWGTDPAPVLVADEVDPYPVGTAAFEPVRVDDPGFEAWAREIEADTMAAISGRPAPVSTPAGPHTGDMNAMLDDLGGAGC